MIENIETELNNINYVYDPNYAYNLIGHAGDLSIGEYIYLYFNIEKNNECLKTKIINAKFSIIGSINNVIATNKFCSFVENKDFITISSQMNNFFDDINMPDERTYIINFIADAFYMALETLANVESLSHNVNKADNL
jgi:hypothetical protein